MSSSLSGACTNAPYPPHPTLRITEFAWHASGQLSKLTLINAETGDQVTRWFFGTTLADSGIASNHLLRTKIYPESDDRPAPATDGPDGVYSRLEYTYNRQRQQTTFKNADGTVHEYDYNKAGAMTEDRVTVLAEGLDDAVLRIDYSYNNRGQSWKVTSYDAATGGSVVNESAFEYDAFGNLIKDWQSHAGAVDGSTPKVAYEFTSGAGNQMRKVSVTYPNGRVVEYLYGDTDSMDDHLNRVSAEKVTGEGQNLVEYRYVGRSWQVRLTYPEPDIMCDYRKQMGQPDGDAGDPYNGYDRFGRTVDMPWTTPIE